MTLAHRRWQAGASSYLDRGSATVMVVAAALCLALLGAVAVTGAAIADAGARAQGAADLAALAAAAYARDERALGRHSADTTCEVARSVAQRNDVLVSHCAVTARAVVHVEVSLRVTGAAGTITVTRTAYAGPRSTRN